MKIKIFLFVFTLFFPNIIFAAPGELNIKFLNTTSNKFDLTLSTSEYKWLWDDDNQKVIFDETSYPRNFVNKVLIYFDSPKSIDGYDIIPWGLIHFSIVVKSSSGVPLFSVGFYLDLRDYNWSDSYTPHDTYILIDDNPSVQKIYLSKGSGLSEELPLNGLTVKIWEYWERSSHSISNFTVPVKLINEVENTSHHFGYLIANNEQIPTNNFEYIKIDDGQVKGGTAETNYNGRKYSFKWSHQIVQPSPESNIYDDETNFSTDYSVRNDREVERNFRAVYPLTIKNLMPELGSSTTAGSIWFKDPTTDNQFHSYSASGSGFVKNETFENLSIQIGQLQNQKYSVKAYSSFTYGGRDYYWYDGDFNPTSQTDLLVSSPTTKTANYKGHLYTNSSTATTTNSQRKIVQSSSGDWAMVYVSSNEVWLSRSTDGTNWGNEIKISNDGSIVDNYPSIAISGNTAYIVWQGISWAGGTGFDYGGIFMRSYNLSNGALGSTVTVQNFTPNIEAFQANPVIDGAWVSGVFDIKMIAWREPNGIKVKRYDDTNGWSSVGTVSGTNSNSYNPSIYFYSSHPYLLCWEDRQSIYNDNIKYVEASYSQSWSFSNAADISPSNWESNTRPQIALVGGNKPTVVWSSRNNVAEGTPSVHIRQRSGST